VHLLEQPVPGDPGWHIPCNFIVITAAFVRLPQVGYGSSQSRAKLTKLDGEVKGLTMQSAGVKARSEDMKVRGPALTSITCKTIIVCARRQCRGQRWKTARTPTEARPLVAVLVAFIHVVC